MASTEGQQHPLGIYFKIWILLFILSGFSYAVDYYQFEGYLRWFLIIVFMMLKAGLIVAVFMHMIWERRCCCWCSSGLAPWKAITRFLPERSSSVVPNNANAKKPLL